MITIGILITGMIVGFILAFRDDGGIALGILGSIIGFIAGILIVIISSGIVYSICDTKYVLQDKQPIYALEDNNSVKGSFFLGCGNVDGDMKYVYLSKDEFGTSMTTIDCDDVSIKEDNEYKPSISTYCLEYKNKFINANFFTLSNKTVITVPKGTIKYNFNIDLK